MNESQRNSEHVAQILGHRVEKRRLAQKRRAACLVEPRLESEMQRNPDQHGDDGDERLS